MKKSTFPPDLLELAYRAEEALQVAVYETIRDHERTGDPVVIWQNGKVVRVSARKLKIKKPRLRRLKE